jgi:hypothetical protein
MTRPTMAHPFIGGSLLWAPALALGQPAQPDFWVELAISSAPGIVIFVIFVAVIALLFGTLRAKFKRDLFARFVDKGQEIPAALLPRPPSRQRELRRGVWLTSLGLGVGLVLGIAGGPRVAAWCLILLFLGAASFLNAVLFYPDESGGKGDGNR